MQIHFSDDMRIIWYNFDCTQQCGRNYFFTNSVIAKTIWPIPFKTSQEIVTWLETSGLVIDKGEIGPEMLVKINPTSLQTVCLSMNVQNFKQISEEISKLFQVPYDRIKYSGKGNQIILYIPGIVVSYEDLLLLYNLLQIVPPSFLNISKKITNFSGIQKSIHIVNLTDCTWLKRVSMTEKTNLELLGAYIQNVTFNKNLNLKISLTRQEALLGLLGVAKGSKVVHNKQYKE